MASALCKSVRAFTFLSRQPRSPASLTGNAAARACRAQSSTGLQQEFFKSIDLKSDNIDDASHKAVNGSFTKDGSKMVATGMYNWRVAAVHNALAKRGKATGPLEVEDLISLGHLDQYHYNGVDACDELIELLGIDANAKVLDVGAGIGGPARYISIKTGCDITGVELMRDLTEAATELTERVGLSHRVRFVTGDFVETAYAQEDEVLRVKYDHVFSLLVILHVPDRNALLKAAFDSLNPGGTFLIDDFALVGKEFTPRERTNLTEAVSAHTVSSIPAYIADLEAVGFTDIEAIDLTSEWCAWTKARHETYRASKDHTIKDHGEKIFNDRVAFYEVIDELFAGGNLGGVRLTGRKRGPAEEKLHRGRKTVGAIESKAVLNEYGSIAK